MADSITLLPRLARHPFAWMLTFALAALAWIPTLRQTFAMFSLPMYGTMGLSLVPFLFFWMLMMAAMMLPALAPIASVRYTLLYQQTPNMLLCAVRIVGFMLGYLSLWLLCGIPVFFLALLANYLVLHASIVAVGLGIFLLIAAGLYQMTPLKQQCLAHCNPFSSQHGAFCLATPRADVLSDIRSGLQHGFFCLGACSGLMLVLLAVGLMNLFWMLLVTVAVFLEKTWSQGPRLSFYLGAALIFYGLLAFIDPLLLPGLSIGY
jgi:predicted metal-binding membrane protein